MDYMYFSIYTITTTGYGDIVPTTSYAKFVTSLANICEVLFLVVFFNALISIRGGQQPDKTQEILDYLKAQSPAKELDVEKRNVTPIRRSSE
jgi:voltage-gated potassium channel Kch